MPTFNTSLDDTPLSIFDTLKRQIDAQKKLDFFSLHQGKTTYPPCAKLSKWQPGDFELLPHEHASPLGIPSLKKRVAEWMRTRHHRTVEDEDITITSGATHAISIVMNVILRPRDEVLLLSPQWLFAYGLVRAANGVPIEVSVFDKLSRDPSFDFINALEVKLTSKTKAIYFNTPNNPTGFHLTRKHLQRLVEFAEEHDLWIVADNAYENYDFTEEGFIDIARIEKGSNRTFSIFTFSKTFAMPGYRIGYVITPATMRERIQKMALYSVYSIATISQYGAFQALATKEEILVKYHRWAKQARDIVVRNLQVPATYPEGGFYTFLDLSRWKNGNVDKFISDCISRGVSLAPGIAFGKMFKSYARLCFTAVNHENLRTAIDIINDVYKRKE